MRVWTNGSFARIWAGDTVYRYRDGALRVEETVKAVKGALSGAPDEIIAWGPKGARLDLALDAKRRKVLDAVALDDERVAGAVSEGRTGPRLLVGPPKGPYERDLALKGRDAPRVAWPKGLIWEAGAEPWSKEDKPSGAGNRGLRLAANAHGVGIAGSSSGHVFLWRHGAEDLACALRVPGQEEASLDAVPTREGLLVTLVIAGREGAVLHLAEDGTVLGRWPDGIGGQGCMPALRLDDDKALAFDADKSVLALLALPDLSELAREAMSDRLIEAACAPRGGAVVSSDGTSVYDITVDDESISVDGPYLLEDAAKPEKDEDEESSSSYEPSRSSGPAQVAFPAGKKLPKEPPWELPLAKDRAIDMRLRSGGRPGRGVRVEVSGAALAKGLVRAVAVRADGKEATLVENGGTFVAVLPELALTHGIDWPLDPKPTKDDEKDAAQSLLDATHFDLELVMHGANAGSELLTVAVGAVGSPSAPIKRTRPIRVE